MSHRDCKKESRDSIKEFHRTIVPELKIKHDINTITHIDVSENEFFRLMNERYGIDYFSVKCNDNDESHILASKIQWFNTFNEAMNFNFISIRWSRPKGILLELDKTSYALAVGDVYSTYTLHAYLYGEKDGDYFRVARINTARTKQLHETAGKDMIKKRPLIISTVKYNLDGSSFIDVNMDMYNCSTNGNLYGKTECQRNLENLLNG